jgi:L-amino acid N-acyltransferase YncA
MTAIREARPADAAAIARIYNQGIEDRVATFETKLRTADDIQATLAAKAPRYPTVVVEEDGEVVAWASCSSYRHRRCYDGVAEVSVYVERAARGHGLGRTALAEVARLGAERGLWKLLSRIFPENQASRALCKALGFREVGVYRRHARLDGQWRDCVIVEKLIGEAR